MCLLKNMKLKKLLATEGLAYTIPQLDLSVKPKNLLKEFEYLYQFDIVDNSSDYLAHPDAILLKDNSFLVMYPEGHGKGKILSKKGVLAKKGKVSYSSRIQNFPKSWDNSRETPTLYRLEFLSGKEKLILISGNPRWTNPTGDGFNVSLSDDEGKTWTEFEKFYGKDSERLHSPIVSMASLTRLKENGQFVDKWMGLFHEANLTATKFINYKTILSFDKSGKMNWSKPEPYLTQYKDKENFYGICEVECIRSENGQGNQLLLLARCNGNHRKKNNNSAFCVSNDEGQTWSEPKEICSALSGERHKAEYVNGKLFITFRDIMRDKLEAKRLRASKAHNWYSEGWVAWVGTYEDIINGKEGEYRIKLAHTYLSNQTAPEKSANADTGYCGNVVFNDSTVYTTTYGCFGDKKASGSGYKTYIIGKHIDLNDVEKLLQLKK